MNEKGLLLLKEGMFWRAYERSAYWLQKKYSLAPIKKYIKRMGNDVLYVGFPESSWGKFMPDIPLPTSTEFVVPLTEPKDDGGYGTWREKVSLSIDKKQVARMEVERRVAAASIPQPSMTAILDSLRRFSVESHTPIECQTLVVELKRLANGIIP